MRLNAAFFVCVCPIVLRKEKAVNIMFTAFLIGVTGFEPTTPSSLTKCASQLRYTPI